MKDHEAYSLAWNLKNNPSNLRLPSDPERTLEIMNMVLGGPQKPAESVEPSLGYHTDHVSPNGFWEREQAFLEKEMLCDRVNWFYNAGNTARETANFFNLDYTIVVRLLRQGGSI